MPTQQTTSPIAAAASAISNLFYWNSNNDNVTGTVERLSMDEDKKIASEIDNTVHNIEPESVALVPRKLTFDDVKNHSNFFPVNYVKEYFPSIVEAIIHNDQNNIITDQFLKIHFDFAVNYIALPDQLNIQVIYNHNNEQKVKQILLTKKTLNQLHKMGPAKAKENIENFIKDFSKELSQKTYDKYLEETPMVKFDKATNDAYFNSKEASIKAELKEEIKEKFAFILKYYKIKSLALASLVIVLITAAATGFLPLVPILIGAGLALAYSNAMNIYNLNNVHNDVLDHCVYAHPSLVNEPIDVKPKFSLLSDSVVTNLLLAFGIGLVAVAVIFAPPSVVLFAAAMVATIPLLNVFHIDQKHEFQAQEQVKALSLFNGLENTINDDPILENAKKEGKTIFSNNALMSSFGN